MYDWHWATRNWNRQVFDPLCPWHSAHDGPQRCKSIIKGYLILMSSTYRKLQLLDCLWNLAASDLVVNKIEVLKITPFWVQGAIFFFPFSVRATAPSILCITYPFCVTGLACWVRSRACWVCLAKEFVYIGWRIPKCWVRTIRERLSASFVNGTISDWLTCECADQHLSRRHFTFVLNGRPPTYVRNT